MLVLEGKLSEKDMILKLRKIKGPRVADRTDRRLLEERIVDGSIRDLIPFPGDIDKYTAILPTLFRRRSDPTNRFTPEEYSYYFKNLIHSPDNSLLELRELLNIAGFIL